MLPHRGVSSTQLNSISIFIEVTGCFKGRMKKREGRSTEALSSQGSEKITKSGKGRVGPCETHLDLLPGTCQSWTTTVPQRLGDRDPIFKYWPEQTIGFKGA